MTNIIFAILLMTFVLLCYNNLNKNFRISTAKLNKELAQSSANTFSLKRLGVTLLLFLSCYSFVSIVNFEFETTEQKHRAELNNLSSRRSQDENELKSMPWDKDKNKGFKIVSADKIDTKFSDVAGLHEAKDEIQDIIRFLRDPKGFGRLGAKSPKGVLLYGEPGTGKTLLARAIAGESNVNFIAVAGSEFDEEYVGIGAARVRQLFETARENAPCIVFIDEIDALAHKRNSQDPAWSAQTINQLLTEMDGLDDLQNKGIVIIGASNRVDAMDPAVLRPGRLDRHILLSLPSMSERAEIISLYLKKIKSSPKVNAEALSKLTPGFSGAQLANLVNEAAIIATKQNKNAIDATDFDVAKDRMVLGSKHAAVKITEKTRKTTAYHEAGHTLIGHLLSAEERPLYKVTISPRGPSLGHTSFEIKEDDQSINQTQIEAIIAMQLAGRAAEELIFGVENITTGAESDLQQATNLAYKMVTRWGYSKRVGPIYYGDNMDFIPKEVIEQEVQAIITRNYARAKELLTNNRDKLERLTAALLDQETLDAKQVRGLLGAK